MNNLIYSLNKAVTATGSLGVGSVKDEVKLRFVIENADSGNIVRVRARILNQADWDTLADLTGSAKQTVNVTTYDEVEVLVTTYESLGNNVRIIATSFNEAGGSTTIDAPAGGSVDNDEISFTSSDSSITIVADPLNNTIDFTTSGGGGGGLSKYVASFNNTSDWVLNGSNYEYTVLSATFSNKPNPVVQTFEIIAGVDDVIYPTIIRNAGNDIILQVTQIPDNRYTGKIIIL